MRTSCFNPGESVHEFSFELRAATTNTLLQSAGGVAVPPGGSVAFEFDLGALSLPPATPVELVSITAVRIVPIKPPPPPPPSPGRFASAHPGGINILFGDGSVRSLPPNWRR